MRNNDGIQRGAIMWLIVLILIAVAIFGWLTGGGVMLAILLTLAAWLYRIWRKERNVRNGKDL